MSKIRFWLKQVFIEKNKWFLLRGNNHSVTLFVYAIPRACIWFNCSKKHNNALNVHKIKKIPPYSTHHWCMWQWLYDQLTILLYWNIIKIHKNRSLSKSVTTAPKFATFLQTPYITSNDKHDYDYMINWPYFCIETSSNPQ